MKIGIITFWKSADNYGQILQSFALQQYLRNHGHDPFLIRYSDIVKEGASFKWYRLLHYIIRLPQYVSWYILERSRQRKASQYEKSVAHVDRKFGEFMEKYLKYTKDIYTDETIHQNPPVADAYICGSDQIWGGDWAYYLDFAPEDKPRIAYAPSLGGLTTFDSDYEARLTILLSKFTFIGMREQSGVNVCHRLGRNDAVKVVDPTLLLTCRDYNRLRIPTKVDKPYIFAYILGNPMACKIEEIMKYAHSQHKKLIYVVSAGQIDGYEHLYPQIGEWIDLICQADIVITNSFHGTVFSLIYNRPFITIPLNQGYERMNTRVTEILTESNLTQQLYQGDLSIIPVNNLDFSDFERYRSEQEKYSAAKLFSILNKTSKRDSSL